MKYQTRIAAALALTIFGGQAARAEIVFDSITGSTAVGELAIAPTTGPLGDSFSTGSSPSALSDVKVDFYNPSNSTTGTVTVSLYASAGNSPTTSLGVLGTVATSAVTPGTFTVVDFSGFSPVSLNPSTRYFILLSTSNGSPLDAVVTNHLSGPGVTSEYNYFSGTAQSNASTGGTFEMQVSTTAAVPEPSALALGVIAAGLCGLTRQARRRQRASAL